MKCFENEYFDLKGFCMYCSDVIAVLFLVFGFSVQILSILWKLVVVVGIQLECTKVMSADAKKYSTKAPLHSFYCVLRFHFMTWQECVGVFAASVAL